MEFSLRTIRQYQKYVKSKRAMNSSKPTEEQSNDFGSVSLVNSVLGKSEHSEQKSYQDQHLFKTNFNSIQSPKEFTRIPVVSRQKTENGAYESYSKRRDSRKLHNTSYQLQKTQKSQKTQKAIADLTRINEISIHHLERNPQNSIRFNKDVETASFEQVQEKTFKRWRTLTKEKSRKSKSPTKNKSSVGKRAKNSPTKKSFNLRIRRTFNNAKTQSFALNLSTIESSNLSVQNMKPARRKSSITPWETEQQGPF